MEEKKLFELRLELKDVTGAPNGKTVLKIELGDVKEQIEGKGLITAKLDDIAIETKLSLSLHQGDKLIGSSNVSLGTLFGKGLLGTVEKWFRLKKDTETTNLKLKIGATLGRNDKKIPKIITPASSHSRRSSKAYKEAKCPYLDKLSHSKDAPRDTLDEIWKIRKIAGETDQSNLIRISLEPDSPAKIEAGEAEFTNPRLDEITIERLQTYSGSQLKQIVKSLCEEARHLSIIASQLPAMRENLTQNIEKRRNLEISSQNETEGKKEQWTSKELELHELQKKKKELFTILIEKQENARKLENELDGLKAQSGDLKRENLRLEAEKMYREDVRQELEEFEALANQTAERKAELKAKVDQAHQELNEAHQRNLSQIEHLKEEKSLIKAKLGEVSGNFDQISKKNNELKTQLNSLKAKLENHDELEQTNKNALTSFHLESQKRNEIQEKLNLLVEQLRHQSEELKTRQESLLSVKQELSQSLSTIESTIEAKEQEIIELRRQLFQSSCKKITLEQVCCVRADLSQMIEDLSRLHSLHLESRDAVLRDLEAGAGYLVKEGEKIHEQAEKLDQLIDAVDTKDSELDGLKGQMGEIKKRNPPYVPGKDDNIDIALADFLNSRQVPVPVQFVRQEPGSYLFGTRKINMKIENNRLIVRIGGGFTGIEEFVDIYTPIEIERQDIAAQKSGIMSIGKIAGLKSQESASPKQARAMMGVFENLARSPTRKK
ncbi:unnamed protein product [Blepharisma stoltei]|uniref:GAR domain-containing protein n=1 Tax=Blepharisma stoltei TaxID=1481888 RepID=A0AAU9KG30_9CILI|nr:unnamed protein product [Blepharisma stoltei]